MTEKLTYHVVRAHDGFELRRYPPHVVAEIVVRGSFEDAGNAAFRTLFGYISGQNRSAGTIAMTAPVVQRDSQQVPMTAPVQQREAGAGAYAVAFVLPASFTLADAPVPTNPLVQLHQRPASLVAARPYRGRWTRSAYEHQAQVLHRAMAPAGLTAEGAPTWARFDPPYVPWFLRRNEVLQQVAQDDELMAQDQPGTQRRGM